VQNLLKIYLNFNLLTLC